jgi:hypothetical protein
LAGELTESYKKALMIIWNEMIIYIEGWFLRPDNNLVENFSSLFCCGLKNIVVYRQPV